MADEGTQSTMRFILEQHAQLTATVGRLSDKVERLSDKVDRTADGINSLLAIAELHEREIQALRESVNAVNESVSAVDERGRDTDEQLNALINTVELYISERRNGKS